VAGDKVQWGFVLQGMRQAAKARARDRQREVAGVRGSGALFCKGQNQLRLRLQNVSKGQFLPFPHFLFLKERERGKGLGIGAQFDPLAASSWQGAAHVLRWGP
jgi:hypothetical protein